MRPFRLSFITLRYYAARPLVTGELIKDRDSITRIGTTTTIMTITRHFI